MLKLVALSAILCAAVAKYSTVQVSNCASSGLLKISNVTMSPSPIVVPGSFAVDYHFETKGELKSPMKLDLKMIRESFLVDLTLPCIEKVGSCTYSDVCTMLNDMIRDNWAGIGTNIGNQIRTSGNSDIGGMMRDGCPVPPTTLSVKGHNITLGDVPGILSFFITGNYHIIAKLINPHGTVVGCIDAKLSLKLKDSSSTGFLFG